MRISPVVTAHPLDGARRCSDRRRRHSFHCSRNALSERRSSALEWLDAVAWRDRLAEIPDRALDGDRRRHGGKLVIYPIGNGAREDRLLTNWAVLVKIGDGGAPPGRRLVAHGQIRGSDAACTVLQYSVCGRKGVDRSDAGVLGIPHVRSRSASALVAWPCHPARRCCTSRCTRLARMAPRSDPRCEVPCRQAPVRRACRTCALGL